MRRVRLLAFPVAAALLLVCINGTAVLAKSDRGADTIEFTFVWPAENPNLFCSGVRIVKAAPKAFTKDSEDCVYTGSAPEPGTRIFDPTWTDAGGVERHWASDYDGQIAVWAKWVIYPDGTSDIVAYY